MKIQLQKVAVEDAALIWEMQKLAFQKLLEKYRDYDTNPASEPLEKVIGRFSQQGRHYYLIKAGQDVVGALCVIDRQDGSVKRLAPIFLMPQFENRGYGQNAIREGERIHGEHGWELDTILQEEKLCCFYEKMGYRQTGETEVVNERMTLVKYENV